MSRALHRLALGNRFFAEFSLDLDRLISRPDPETVFDGRHIFITGLARAGTTILLRRLSTDKAVHSLSYRDMPFVLAPRISHRLRRRPHRVVSSTERAHGDGIQVNLESPEALEEVFWRLRCGDEYISDDCLVPHVPRPEIMEGFAAYIGCILASSKSNGANTNRYLSKNNNNLLRLGSLQDCFPNSVFLVPFRDPFQHASSLLRQHNRFNSMQAKQPFVLEYMTLLGHHEFGLGHIPFRFPGTGNRGRLHQRGTLEYWLETWCDVHSWLLRVAGKNTAFLSHEHLCEGPDAWARVQSLTQTSCTPHDQDVLRVPAPRNTTVADAALKHRCRDVHERLLARSIV